MGTSALFDDIFLKFHYVSTSNTVFTNKSILISSNFKIKNSSSFISKKLFPWVTVGYGTLLSRGTVKNFVKQLCSTLFESLCWIY